MNNQSRSIHVFIVKLLVDEQDTTALRGTISSVQQNKAYSFADGKDLLEWLNLAAHTQLDEKTS